MDALKTDLLLCFLESTIDIILRFPYTWHALVIISKALFKMIPKLVENYRISSLLINFGPEALPGSLA